MSRATRVLESISINEKVAKTDMYCEDCGAEFSEGEKITCKNKSESKDISECKLKAGKKPSKKPE